MGAEIFFWILWQGFRVASGRQVHWVNADGTFWRPCSHGNPAAACSVCDWERAQ